MATIRELVDKHSKVPGDIKIRLGSWEFDEWFRPFYYTKSYWYGETYEHACYQFDDTAKGWQLYTEPKPKVKRWLWVEPISGHYQTTMNFYSDELAREILSPLAIKLPFSEMEFDE